MKVERIKDTTSFGIYKGGKNTPYGTYMWGIFRGKKIEVYDAKNTGQKLIYVSDNRLLKWLKSKLIYVQNGVKRIIRSEAR